MTDPPRYCLRCDYRLDGLPAGMCPECGNPFHPHDEMTFAYRPYRPGWGALSCALTSLAAPVVFVLWTFHPTSQHIGAWEGFALIVGCVLTSSSLALLAVIWGRRICAARVNAKPLGARLAIGLGSIPLLGAGLIALLHVLSMVQSIIR